MVYQWKTGARVKGDAQASGELFERLSKTPEGLTARTLLEANKPDDAPLHNDYEWDNEKAADEWRLHQSRHFINSIQIVIAEKNDESELVRGFVITTEKSKYEPITAVVRSPDKYETMLSSALSELQTFKRKYEQFKELAPVFTAIEEIKAKGLRRVNSFSAENTTEPHQRI